MKTKAFRLAAVFLVLWIYPSLVCATPPEIKLSGRLAAGEYSLQVQTADVWQSVAVLEFDHRFTTRRVDLTAYIQKDQPARVRLVQKGGGAAHIDAVLMGDTPPRKSQARIRRLS